MLWLLWCPVELLSFNQNEISDIPAAALLWQDDLPSSFWRDNLSFFFFFLKAVAFHRGALRPSRFYSAQHVTLCRNQMYVCRFTKPTLPLLQTTNQLNIWVPPPNPPTARLCQCVYACVTMQEWPRVAPYGALHVFDHLIAAGGF